MEKKLSQKERKESATKGFIEDQNFATKSFIEDQNFVTKEYMESQQYVTKEYMESKQYVTRDYLDKTLDERFEKAQRESFSHFEAIMEVYNEKFYTLIELFEGRFERIEHRLDVLEA